MSRSGGFPGPGAAQDAVRTRESRLPVQVEDVHPLVQHEPYESAEHPVPIDATIVHAGRCCTRWCRSRTAGGYTSAWPSARRARSAAWSRCRP
jgi:hypothetical protein